MYILKVVIYFSLNTVSKNDTRFAFVYFVFIGFILTEIYLYIILFL